MCRYQSSAPKPALGRSCYPLMGSRRARQKTEQGWQGAGLCSVRWKTVVLQEALANADAVPCLSVGADAYIGPLENCEFAADYRKNGAFCRVDVGIDPYSQIRMCLRICRGFPMLPCVPPGGAEPRPYQLHTLLPGVRIGNRRGTDV